MSGRTIISHEQGKPLSEWICSFATLFGQQQLLDGNKHSTTAEWIRSFETLIGQQQLLDRAMLPADDYLIPALRIAFSLADQICKAEEAGQSPMPSSDWMDSIVVHLQSNGSEDGRFKGEAAEEDDKDDKWGNNIRVEILPSLLFNTTDNNNSRQASATDGIIYSLGMVFYEIFTRGERPAELEQQHEGERPNGTLSHIGTEELSEGFNPIDLGGELSTSDNLLGACNLSDNENDLLYNDIALQGHGPRGKKRTQNDNHNICSVSFEPLQAKGVPKALCDLVVNMMNCANGTISNDETYQNMLEVRDDLRLMLDKPLIYLHDQDIRSLSTKGLQFGSIVFGRNAELSTMTDAYRRSVTGESELVIISGQSGTGKSLLALEFGKYVMSSGGILLFGKFDQLQQGKPFSALASAFEQYCGILVQSCELRQKLVRQVNCVLGREAYHLTKLIPSLAIILGPEPPSINNDDDCFNAQKRLEYLLCQFVEVISSTFAVPVTLLLDDLQWADQASIAAVKLLLTGGLTSQQTRFFFLGCIREGENNCDPFWRAMCNSNLLDARLTNIKLDCMGEDTLNTMVSETLCLSPRLTRALSSIIYHKTKGNPLFVSRLILSLSKDGLLRLSLSRGRWEWDEEKILCQNLPDDVAEFLTHSIGKLPEDVKSSLRIFSCFGASLISAFVKTLERALDINLVDSLDVAVAEGLLDKTDDQYRFSHDRIQEAAYNMMNFLDRCEHHFTYGMALAPLTAGEEGHSTLLLFTAATQLNLAGPEAIQDGSQNAMVANLNLRAGKKAMEMSDFEAAYSYFDYGISFLRKNHWKEHYTLSLELFDLAARCALTNGDIVSLKLLSQQVMTKAHSLGDKLNVMYFAMCSLAYSYKLQESIEKGLDILSKLGVELRGCGSSTEACVQETKDLLSACTDDEILNTRRMTDPTMIMAMKFLGKLETGMTQIMPKAVPYVTQRIIQLSLSHGMSPVSPIGIVHLGSYMAKLGDIRGGYHYVQLALSLLDKVGSRESAGEVICIGTQVRAYVEPLQAALEYHNEGYAAAMASGDIIQAAANFMLSCGGSLFAGVNLQAMREKHDELIKFSKERKMIIFMVQTQCGQRSIFKLIGTDEEPKYASSEEQNILATNTSVMATYYFHKAFISFMFRSYDGTEENIEKYFACISNTWANLLLAHAFHAFYVGIISFWLARKSRDGDGQLWQERGKLSTLALEKMAKSSRWNFENKWYLLEAEDAYCNNDVEAAKTYYEKAIASAKDHKFVHEEALACELAAYFYLELGENEKAMQYFLLAHEKYHEWGALGKRDSLFNFVESIFAPASTNARYQR